MDPTQEKTLEEVLAGITIEDAKSGYEYVGSLDPHYGAVPPLTVSSIDGNINGTTYSNISLNGGGYTIGAGINTAGHVWTTSGTGSPYTITSPYQSAKIQLNGKDADIEVNGWSLMDTIQKIEERLNILHPNTELETEWEELRALGEQYRELEKHIIEKQATWNRLKAMPPPHID
jgi:hypothetical protein